MSRIFSLSSSFFSAASVILLVLGLLVLGGSTIADEPLGPDNGQPAACQLNSNHNCPGPQQTSCGNDNCCFGSQIEGDCCICQNTTCTGNETCTPGG